MIRSIEDYRLFKIAKAALVVIIPVMILALTFNLVVRTQDLYARDMQASGSLEETGVRYDEQDMAQQIASYLWGNVDRGGLQTVAGDEADKDYIADHPVFTDEDYAMLDSVRLWSNIMLGAFVVALICFVMIFALMTRNGYAIKAKFRRLYLWGALITVAIAAGVCGASYSGGIRGFCLGIMTRGTSAGSGAAAGAGAAGDQAGALLMQIFDAGLVHMMVWVQLGCAVLILLIVMYIVWTCTKPRNIFESRRYFY